MGLAAQGGFHHFFYQIQGGRVGGVLECVEDGGASAVGEVKFAGGGGCEVM